MRIFNYSLATVGPGLIGFLGGFNILPDNSIQAISGAFPIIGTFSRATAFDATAWHHVDLLVNLATQTYDVTIDSSNGACTGAPMASFSNATFDSFGSVGANDSGYMDNFQISALDPAPEPSSVLLIATGLVLVGRRKLKSLKK